MILSESVVFEQLVIPIRVAVISVIAVVLRDHLVFNAVLATFFESVQPRVGIILKAVHSCRHCAEEVVPCFAEMSCVFNAVGDVIRALSRPLDGEITCVVDGGSAFFRGLCGYENDSERAS